ncbi:MAG: tetratricopeptide repeat protein [Deltaproteobacteria bacterium]|nr:MAG: tetratricopeptide repeat protein [Deltaproteobacteria bacterium]
MKLGRYEIEAVLGRGGMGTVHRATLVGPGGFRKPVALKVLHKKDASLRREARIGGLLRHRHLVDVYEVGEADGRSFCAMELCEGGSLAEYVPLPPRAVVEVGLAVCDALEHASRVLDLVHLDLKPANLLLTADGEVKVADLGIAHAEGFEVGGGVRGSPAYMPPEQARGGPTDTRSDIYALGRTLLELATGRPESADATLGLAWTGSDATFHSGWSGSGPLPGSESIPSWLAPALERCLLAHPDDRWQTMGAVADALRGLDVEGPGLAEYLDLSPAAVSAASPGPAQAPLFGREQLVDEVVHALDTPGSTALVGPAGVGKSAVALAAALRWQALTEHAFAITDLASATDRFGALGMVAAALALPLSSTDPEAQIGAWLADAGPFLLVLDNIEHLRAHTSVVSAWRAGAPELRILTTSRVSEPLGQERPITVGPLDLEASVGLLARGAAERGLELDAASLVPLARRLDGLPLALELAAGRLGVLSPEDVLAHLDAAFLRSGSSGRHATLEAALGWSWEQLGADGRRNLARLSAFVGGFDVEAAEAMLAPAPVLTSIETLLHHSLIQAQGERFGLLHSVRDFVHARLEPAERQAAAERHARYFTRFALDDGWLSGAAATAMSEDRDNVLEAYRYAVRELDAEVALDLLWLSWSILRLRGPLGLGTELVDALLERDGLPPLVERRALLIASATRVAVGELAEAVDLAEASLAASREHADGPTEVRALDQLGEALWRQGELQRAAESYRRSMERAQEVGEPAREARARGMYGALLHQLGHLEQALEAQQQAVQRFRELGLPHPGATALGNLATLLHTLGRLDEAERAYEQVIPELERQGNRRVGAVMTSNLGNLLRERGDIAPARQLFERALAAHRDLGNRAAEARTLGCLALSYEGAEAIDYFEQAIAIATRCGDARQEGYWTMHVALAIGGSEGLERIAHSLAIFENVGAPGMISLAHAGIAELAFRMGNADRGREALARAEDIAPPGDGECDEALDRVRALAAASGG